MDETRFSNRLAAILAADAAGYSRLMAADELGTVTALDAARAVFHSQAEVHRGRVVDMAGDSVLALFDTASGAVAAALAIQASINLRADAAPEDRRMRFRIGVHLGDVIEKSDGTVYGDGVNIAARLQALAEPGGITISDAVRGAVRGKVAASFDDQGEQVVKNIAEPVHAFVVRADGAAPAQATKTRVTVGPIDLSLPDNPSIAVLPFANVSADADQKYFADGVTEDIITQLSRFKSLFVIARNSSFAYRDKATDMPQIGRELGVRYLVEGSIRRSSNRVRLNARLIDSLSGNYIWADTYDRVLEDIFAVQEEVTACIVAAVAPSVDVAESLRVRRRPQSVGAYEMAIRARALILRQWRHSDRTKVEEGLQLARSALRVDPDSVIALTAIATAQFHGVYLRTATDREAAWQEGMAAVERAISLANSSLGHAVKALLLLHTPSGSRIDEALVEAQTAVRINPQDSIALTVCGHLTADAGGDPVEAIRLLERSVRINPRDPSGYDTYAGLAKCCLYTREYRKGVEWAMRSRGQASGHALTQLMLAALLVGLDELDQAKAAMEVARQLAPDWVQSRLDGQAGIREGANRQHLITFIRVAAGLEPPEAAQAFR